MNLKIKFFILIILNKYKCSSKASNNSFYTDAKLLNPSPPISYQSFFFKFKRLFTKFFTNYGINILIYYEIVNYNSMRFHIVKNIKFYIKNPKTLDHTFIPFSLE